MIGRTFMRTLALAWVSMATLALLPSVSQAHLLDFKEVGKFGGSGSAAGKFNTPVGVAVNEGAGEVYVVDQGDNRVERFASDGAYLAEFNGAETPAGAFQKPSGIAVDNSGGPADGHVYVADPSQGVVDIFDASGKYLSQIAVEAPGAVAVDASGNLWVGTEHSVFDEYNEAGVEILSRSTESGVLGIAVDSRYNVYLSLASNEKTIRYSPPNYEDGVLAKAGNCSIALAADSLTGNIFEDGDCGIHEWPPFGEGPGLWERLEEEFAGRSTPTPLSRSRGVAVDSQTKTVYATSEATDEVSLFEGAILPDATTGPARQVTGSSASISGSVNPDGTKTTYFFEWGETTDYGSATAAEEDEGEVTLPANAELSGLTSDHTYHYRLVARNKSGTTFGADEMFVTLSVPPVIEGAPSASGVTRSTVILRATVKPSTKATTYRFLYVEAAAYDPTATDPYAAGGMTAVGSLGAGGGGTEVETVANGLKPGTTYHYTVAADSEDGNVDGADGTFTTAAGTPPLASTGQASGVEQNTATIGGVVGATNGLPCTYGFEIGTSTDYGPPTGLGSVGAGLNEAFVSLSLSGLQPGTTYHYRLTVTNLDGTSYGEDRTFTTSTFASTFATPPAPLPFVAVPQIAFPRQAKHPGSGKRNTKGKKARKRVKRRHAHQKLKGTKARPRKR